MMFIKNILFAFLFLFIHPCFGQTPSIIPEPVSVINGKGEFDFRKPVHIQTDSPTEAYLANYFKSYLQKHYQWEITENSKAERKLTIDIDTTSGYTQSSYYEIAADNKQIRIKAQSPSAGFYGIQTLIQLLPVDTKSFKKITIPTITIKDSARFSYRGLHLDVCRHFFTVEFIKRYLDYMAYHKLNYFHWHLTDDQGWRIEIKKFPKLMSIASCRNYTIIGHEPGDGIDSTRYCGYYTQEQIKEVVEYATERFITVIPEIEMPGHSSAALAAYPELGCPGTGPYKVEGNWGVFEDVYCAGNDTVFTFLQGVLEEVIPLFPGPYIHIGGDECPKHNWRKCYKCQNRIQQEQLRDVQQLQSYFIKRIEKYVNEKGKTIIGWDEILDGGVAPRAVIMSWRGKKGGISAAQQKHYAIMTAADYVYLDHAQQKPEDSLTIGGYTPIEVVYKYEPVPKELTPDQQKYILGSQGNLWTEYISSVPKLEYMLFPRVSALSEMLWSLPSKKSFPHFAGKMKSQEKRYRLWGNTYYKNQPQ